MIQNKELKIEALVNAPMELRDYFLDPKSYCARFGCYGRDVDEFTADLCAYIDERAFCK